MYRCRSLNAHPLISQGSAAEGVFDRLFAAKPDVETKESSATLTNDGVPETTSTHVMTKFKETGSQTHVDFTGVGPHRDWSLCYSAAVPSGFTKRAYQIGSFTWNSSTTITPFPLIGKLSQTTPALALFKLWKMARCSFTVMFKMTSSQYHQGAAIVGWLPCVNWSAVPKDLQSCSGYNATIIAASKQESINITIPYCSPEDWMDTGSFSNSSAEHATVFFIPMFPLLTTNASVPASIPMEVWATIDDIDLSGAQSQMATKRVFNDEIPEKTTRSQESQHWNVK